MIVYEPRKKGVIFLLIFFTPVIPTNVNRQNNIAYRLKGYHIYMYTDNYAHCCFFGFLPEFSNFHNFEHFYLPI